MASTHCVSTTESLNADCVYVREAMFESALFSVTDSPNHVDMEVSEFNSAEPPATTDSSAGDETTVMDLQVCGDNLSLGKVEENLNRKLSTHEKETSNVMEIDLSSDNSFSTSETANDSLCNHELSNQAVADGVEDNDSTRLKNEAFLSPETLQISSESDACLSPKTLQISIENEVCLSPKALLISNENESCLSPKTLQISSDSECGNSELRVAEEVDNGFRVAEKLNTSNATIDLCDTSLSENQCGSLPDVDQECASKKPSPKNSECGLNEDVEALLNTPISKDYVNCVWSNEPLQSNLANELIKASVAANSHQSELEGNKRLSEESITTETDKTSKEAPSTKLAAYISNSNGSGSKGSPKATPKPKFKLVAKNQNSIGKKMNNSDGKSKDCSSLENSQLNNNNSQVKASSPQSKKRKLPSNIAGKKQRVLSMARLIKPVEPSTLKNVRKKRKDETHQKEFEKHSVPSIGNLHSSGEISNPPNETDLFIQNLLNEEKLRQRLQASYKRFVLFRSTPVYKPPENSRFFNGKVYECKPCGDKFILQNSLLTHISRKSVVITYKCSKCEKILSFNNRCSLLQHLNDHGLCPDSISPADLFMYPPNEGELPSGIQVTNLFTHCHECGKPVSSLKKHMQGNDVSDPVTVPGYAMHKDVLTCSSCGQLLPSNCSLFSHLRFHLQKSPFTCPECGDLFDSHADLFEHVKACCFLICKKGTYRCPCKRKFGSSITLKHHILASHITKLYKCKKCKTACATVELMKTHLYQEHDLQWNNSGAESENHHLYYRCQLCPGKVVNCYLSEKHADSHSQEGYTVQDVIECGRCKCIVDHLNQIPKHRSLCFSEEKENSSTTNTSSSPSGYSVSDMSGKDDDWSSGVLTPTTLFAEESTQSNESPPAFPNRPKRSKVKISSPLKQPSAVQRQTCTSSGGEKRDDEVNAERVVDATDSNNVSSDHCRKTQNAGETVICRICKHSIASSGDRISIKMHFINYHQAIFLQALHNGRRNNSGNDSKVVFKFPIQKVFLKGQKSKRGCAQETAKKKKNSPTSLTKKSIIPSKKEIPARKPIGSSKKPLKGSPKRSKINLKKFETLPYKIGTVSADNVGQNRTCYKCSYSTKDKLSFLTHIATHKTNPSDLQCPVCGMCFIVRPPLEKHLLVQHNIKNVRDFLKRNGFVDAIEEENELVVDKVEQEHQNKEVLHENQCKVCRMQFDSALLLEKHFRVHGGAFLLANLKAKKF